MSWRCEWCGELQDTDDPPCQNCGHDTFEEAPTQEAEADADGPTFACLNCGHEHQEDDPPCDRCGGSTFQRRTGAPEEQPLAGIKAGLAGVLKTKHLAGYGAVALLLMLVIVGAVSGVTLPGFAAETPEGPPPIADPPGSGETIGTLSVAGVEETYLEVYNVRRSGVGGGTVTRNATSDEAAAYYNKGRVDARYTNANPPTEGGVARFPLQCDRPQVVSYEVAYDRTPGSVDRYKNETAMATALVDAYIERGNRIRSAEVGTMGLDIHVGPDGRVFVTYVLC